MAFWVSQRAIIRNVQKDRAGDKRTGRPLGDPQVSVNGLSWRTGLGKILCPFSLNRHQQNDSATSVVEMMMEDCRWTIVEVSLCNDSRNDPAVVSQSS